LHRRQPHASGGAEYQQRLAWEQPPTVLERVVRRTVGHHEGGGGREVHAVRDGDEALGVHRDLLGEAAPPSDRHHPVPHAHSGEALAERRDHASHLAARRERQRRLELVLALDDERVREVDAARLDADDHLAPARRTGGDVFNYQALRRAVRLAQDGFHLRTLSQFSSGREFRSAVPRQQGQRYPNSLTLSSSPHTLCRDAFLPFLVGRTYERSLAWIRNASMMALTALAWVTGAM